MAIRPLIGGIGFLMIVPLVSLTGIIDTPAANSPLGSLISYFPSLQSLTTVLVIFLILLLTTAVFNYLLAIVSAGIAADIQRQLQTQLHHEILRANWLHLAQINPADYSRLMTEEIDSVASAVEYTLNIISQFCLTAVYLVLCLYLSPSFTFVAIGLGTLLLVVTLPINLLIQREGVRNLRLTEDIFRLVQDQFRGLKEIKSSNSEISQQARFTEAAERIHDNEVEAARLSQLAKLVHSCLAAFAFCALAWYGLTQATLDLVTLTLLALIFSRLLPQISNLHTLVLKLTYLQPALAFVSDFVISLQQNQEEMAEEMADGCSEEGPGRSPFNHANGIRLDHLGFTYPHEPSPILNALNVEIPGSGLVAIVGESGIGKTTLANIIAGLISPSSGSMRNGDVPITPNNRVLWRNQVALLPQEPFVIDGTIRENLLFLSTHARSDKDLVEALKMAAAPFASLAGLDHRVTDQGMSLSGGERQRLLLARALIQDKDILVLDEVTSQLDLESEQAIIDCLVKLSSHRLVILVTHRPAIIEVADQVINIGSGQSPSLFRRLAWV